MGHIYQRILIMKTIRKYENFHILLWLIKDMSWLMSWRILGIAMIFPTLICAIFIAFSTRNIKSELYHNLAVICWICANSFWMITEFFGLEEQFKTYAIIPFLLGIVFIFSHYLKKS